MRKNKNHGETETSPLVPEELPADVADGAVPARPGRRARILLSPARKCQAVLQVWTERQSISEVCRSLGVQRPQVERWEELALEGMLKNLEPKRIGDLSEPEKASLSSHLEKLLEKRLRQAGRRQASLETKLQSVQDKLQERN